MPASPIVQSYSPATAYSTKDNILLPTAAGSAAAVQALADARAADADPDVAATPPTGGG